MNRIGFVAVRSILVFAAFAAIVLMASAYAEDAADPSHFTYARLYHHSRGRPARDSSCSLVVQLNRMLPLSVI